MKRECIQCGKVFTISETEVEFFKKKNLSLPKRCKQCREKNKGEKNGYGIVQTQGNTKKSNATQEYESYYYNPPFPFAAVIYFAIAAGVMFTGIEDMYKIFVCIILAGLFIHKIFTYLTDKVFIQEFDLSPYKYTFYSTDDMVEHYVKHRKQTDCKSMEDYLLKANMVVIDKGNISKKKKDSDDTVFYNEKTQELAVVAKAGYLRTYFTAPSKYYNKQ